MPDQQYKIIIGARQDRATGEITMVYRDVTEVEFAAWMRHILNAARALRGNDLPEVPHD